MSCGAFGGVGGLVACAIIAGGGVAEEGVGEEGIGARVRDCGGVLFVKEVAFDDVVGGVVGDEQIAGGAGDDVV